MEYNIIDLQTLQEHQAPNIASILARVVNAFAGLGDIFTDAHECSASVSCAQNLQAFAQQISSQEGAFASGRLYADDKEVAREVSVCPDGTLVIDSSTVAAIINTNTIAFALESDADHAEVILFDEPTKQARKFAVTTFGELNSKDVSLQIADIGPFYAAVIRREINLADMALASLDERNDSSSGHSNFGEPSNEDRAEWAMQSVETYAAATGLSIEDDGLDTAAGDLVASLMHLCNWQGVDFGQVLATATMHFEAEKNEA